MTISDNFLTFTCIFALTKISVVLAVVGD